MCIVYEQVRDYFPSVQCWNNADQLFSSKIFSIFPIHGLFYLLCFPSWILIQLHTIHTRHLHKRISIFRFRFPFHPFVFQTKKIYIFPSFAIQFFVHLAWYFFHHKTICHTNRWTSKNKRKKCTQKFVMNNGFAPFRKRI